MKKLSLILILSFSVLSIVHATNSTEGDKTIFQNDSWDFLEKEFILIPLSKASCIDKVGLKAATTLTGVVAAYGLSYISTKSFAKFWDYLSKQNEPTPQDLSSLKYTIADRLPKASEFLLGLFPVAAIATFIYSKTHDAILHKLENDQLQNFIKNWPQNKARTPERFHPDFDHLYDEFKKNPKNRTFIENTHYSLKRAIKKHFGCLS